MQDDATGNESQSAKEEALNPFRTLPRPCVAETQTQEQNSGSDGSPAEEATWRRVSWFVHLVSLPIP